MASEVTASAVMPSATPTEAEVEDWGRLPRDEQLRRLREVLADADGAAASETTMEEILAEARRRADQRRG
ncbi:hypothetical protein C5688_17090 [Methylocystis sp. MitZ-2018]|nr:hypothetical protein C5688_17090 [Methylocystis sp. MitZ-2018]